MFVAACSAVPGVTPDAGQDSGISDAGGSDAGLNDGGGLEPDAGVDAGALDAGGLDAGPVCRSCATHQSSVIDLGVISVTALNEISGIAVSRAHRGVLYAHNDSGGLPVVYA